MFELICAWHSSSRLDSAHSRACSPIPANAPARSLSRSLSLNHDLKLRLSSFTFGRAQASLALLSLNHDLHAPAAYLYDGHFTITQRGADLRGSSCGSG